MTKVILVDEFHITVSASRGLAPRDYDRIRQTLDTAKFQISLRRAVKEVFRQYPTLKKAHFTLTR